MANNNQTEKKLDQLIGLALKQMVYLMFKDGYTMDEIAKNMHIRKQTVVKILEGLRKKGKP